MNTETVSELHQSLRRIFGDEADQVIQTRLENQEFQEAEQLLLTAGIDPNEVYEQAVNDIQLTERLMEQGINPPRRLDRLSEAEFFALDERQLESYLTAYDIDVSDMVKKVTSDIQEQRQWYKFGWPQNWGISTDFWLRPPAIAATLAFCLVVVGGGLSLTFFQSEPVTDIFVAQVEPDKGPATPSLAINQIASAIPEESFALASQPATQVALVNPVFNQDSDIGGWLPSTELNKSVVINDIQVPDSEKGLYAEARSVIATRSAQLVQEPINLSKVTEFVFSSGDTLSHGMSAAGLPANLWPAIIDRVGTQFQPGEKLIVYAQNDQFEQLVVIRKKQPKTIVAADLTVETTSPVKTRIHIIHGRIDTSLYTALLNDLDESVVWRISTRLKHMKVPLRTLPKDSHYEIRIEQIVGKDGETIRYGAIKSIRINTQNKETSSKGQIYEYSV
jgi:hypothetical protein